MEEKKQCTCGCEAKEQKPTELTEEEMEKVSGGMSKCGAYWVCKDCGASNFGSNSPCKRCGKPKY